MRIPQAGLAFALSVGLFAGAGIVIVWTSTRDSPVMPDTPATTTVTVTPLRVAGGGVDPWSGRGLADELHRALNRMPGFSASITDSADHAAASYVVTGTIARRGGRSAIGIQILRGTDKASIWNGAFWRAPSDLQLLSMELAELIGQAIRLDQRKAMVARESLGIGQKR